MLGRLAGFDRGPDGSRTQATSPGVAAVAALRDPDVDGHPAAVTATGGAVMETHRPRKALWLSRSRSERHEPRLCQGTAQARAVSSGWSMAVRDLAARADGSGTWSIGKYRWSPWNT